MGFNLCGGVIYVLDAAALFASYQLMLPHNSKAVTTKEVVEEVRDLGSRTSLELSLSAGKLVVVEVPNEFLVEAVRVARDLGEFSKLSKADISLTALMIMLVRVCGGVDVLVVTDDYSIQNIATYLGLKVLGVKRRTIDRVVKYVSVCRLCGYVDTTGLGVVCPVCGGFMSRRPSTVESSSK
jgi:UPF0271 protein